MLFRSKPASHRSFAVDSAILSGMDCCAVCEFFVGYLCRGEDSPLYKRNVDPTAKCPVFIRQIVAVESITNELETSDAPPIIAEIDLEDELNDQID